MRAVIWEKDDVFHLGNQIIQMDPTVVELPESIPLSWMYHWNNLIGSITNLRLEDGEIVGELTITDQNVLKVWPDIEKQCRYAGFYSDTEIVAGWVTKGILRGACIQMLMGFPRMVK